MTIAAHNKLLGFTLMELVVAMVASAMLLAGLGSVMLIARQIAYIPPASLQRTEAAQVFDRLADELCFATCVVERTESAIEFVVSDRGADGTADRIRYAWSGTPGDPLLKSVNGGTPFILVDTVEQLQFVYSIEAETTRLATTSNTSELLLAGNTNVSSSEKRLINDISWSAQQVNPALFLVAAPTGALSWTPTRVEFVGTSSGTPGDTLLVRISNSGTPNDSPTSTALCQASIPESALPPSQSWVSASFPGPTPQLALHRRYDLIWAGIGANACELTSNSNASSGVLESPDAGASWQLLIPRQVYYRLYGAYTTPGPAHEIARRYLSRVQIVMRSGPEQHSRVETSIPLANRPEILAAYWRADFDGDPTIDDVNGDAVADWQAVEASASEVSNPEPYDPDTVINGVWYASGKLSTQPPNDFAAPTIAEVRFRDTVVGGSGAIMIINADWSDGLCSPFILRVRMDDDGTQTLTLAGKSDDGTDVVLFQHEGLSSDFVQCRLTIVPDADLVNVQINDVDQGTYSYSVGTPLSTDRAASLVGDTGEAEFDYAEVRVLETE